jgi:hypothetical protein
VTAWLGWHVLESVLASTQNLTMTVFFVDRDGRVARDEVKLNVDRSRLSGQALTPAPETFSHVASAVDTGGPEVSLIAPRVPTAIAVGPHRRQPQPDQRLAVLHLAVGRRSRRQRHRRQAKAGQTADGSPPQPEYPGRLIFDPTVIPRGGGALGPNRNFPGMIVTFNT